MSSSSPPSRSSLGLDWIAPNECIGLDHVPIAVRSVTLSTITPTITNNAEYEGETVGREVMAVRHTNTIHIETIDSCLSHPIQSPFLDAQVKMGKEKDDSVKIGELSSVVRDDGKLTSMDWFPDAANRECEYTSAVVSPSGVVFGSTGEAEISAAVAVTHSQGGAQVWVQKHDRQWRMQYDMTSYLHRAYVYCQWSDELRPFDSGIPIPAVVENVRSLHEFNRRRALVDVQCVAWSNKFSTSPPNVTLAAPAAASSSTASAPSPFILLALGTKAGVVTIWKINLPMLSADINIMPGVGGDVGTAAHSAGGSHSHPELVGSISLGADNSILVSSLSFSPVYFDESTGRAVCALGVGASDGKAHVYAFEPYVSSILPPVVSASPSAVASTVSTFPIQLLLAATMRLGNKFMSCSTLKWSQTITDTQHDRNIGANEPACSLCFDQETCALRQSTLPGTRGLRVHHLLAIGCSGQIQVAILHPSEYLKSGRTGTATPASAASSARAAAATSLCRLFAFPHSHTSHVNSFVWSIRSHSSSSSTTRTHVTLLSAADDDRVHRWNLRDTKDVTRAIKLIDGCTSDDIRSLDRPGSVERSDSQHTRLSPFPSSAPLHGCGGLVPSGDGLLLYSFVPFSATTHSGSSGPSHFAGKKRTPIGMVLVRQMPQLDLPDEEREEFARLSLAYSTVWTGEETAATAASVDTSSDAPRVSVSSAKQKRRARKSTMEQLKQQELAERAGADEGKLYDNEDVTQIGIEIPDLSAPTAPPAPSTSSSKRTPSKKVASGKKQKKRRKIGEGDASEDDDEDEDGEWKASGGDGSESEESDDASEDDDDVSYAASETGGSSRKSTKRKKSKGHSATHTRKKLKSSHSTLFEDSSTVPIPLPIQSKSLEDERKGVQKRLLTWLIARLKEASQRREQERLVASRPSDLASLDPLSLPFVLSTYTVRTWLHLLANPFHLSIPPILTELPTTIESMDITSSGGVGEGEEQSVEGGNLIPFSLYWRLLPQLIPSDIVFDGYDSIFEVGDSDRKIYPIDAFPLPVHRQLPFLFLADAMVEFAEATAEQSLGGRVLETVWLDDNTATPSKTSLDLFILRLVLCILRVALTARTPYIALSQSERVRAESLHARLVHVLQLSYAKLHLSRLRLAVDPSSTLDPVTRMQTVASLPYPAAMVLADWTMKCILGLTPLGGANRPDVLQSVWQHPQIVSLSGTLLALYTMFAAAAPRELSFVQSLTQAASASNAMWSSALADHRDKWPETEREKCPLCESDVPLTSSTSGVCPHAHSLIRCRRTLLLISSATVLQCHTCGGSTMNLPAATHKHICIVCQAATTEVAV